MKRCSKFKNVIVVLAGIVLLSMLCGVSSAGNIHIGVYGTWGLQKNQMFQEAKNNNFHIVISSDVNKCHQMGLKCLYPLEFTKEIAYNEAEWNKYVGNVKKNVLRYKYNKAVFGWYIADEPDWNDIPPARYSEISSIIKSIDNSKPTVGVLTIPDKWHEYFQSFDVIAIDPYLPNTHTGRETDKVSEWIDRINIDFNKYVINKPLWIVLGVFEQNLKGNVKSAFRRPTPKEFDIMLRSCLNSNVSGILIFSLYKEESEKNYKWNIVEDDPSLWDVVKRVPNTVLNYDKQNNVKKRSK